MDERKSELVTKVGGRVSAIDYNGRTIWIADAHRDDCPALANSSIWSHGLDRSNPSSERLKLCC